MEKMNLQLKGWFITLLSLVLCFSACSDSDDGPDNPELPELTGLEKQKQAIVDELKKDNSLSDFTNVFAKMDISEISANSFTVFAMNNEALGSSTNITQDMLERHIVKGTYTLEKLKALKQIETLNGDVLTLSTDAEGNLCMNNVTLKNPVVKNADNSIVYVTNNIIRSAYITTVFDYLPAVGQFVNKMPEYEAGDTKETIRQKAEQAIKGPDTDMIHLGGFGGYVVFGFDHTVKNIEGERDFRILGNAFWAAANPNPGASSRGGSCEPGIIMVAYDRNNNGKPDDDEWYEIAGSEYNKPATIKNYEITYYKPSSEPSEASNEYIRWEDNQGNSGYKAKNATHGQPYYPQWITDDKITFKGTLLPNNGIEESGIGQYWVLYSYDFGYADNAPNNDDESAIDIAWAVDKNGNKVDLPGIDFVKVYTGVNQECGWLGEVSTEIAGAEDLHYTRKSIPTRK